MIFVRWAVGVLASTATLALLLACPGAAAPALVKPEEEHFHLLGDARVAAQLDSAGEFIRDQQWDQAARFLQMVLDLDEDRIVDVGAPQRRTVSARAEARHMLAALPPAGRKAYHAAVGPRAAEMLKEAVKDNDESKLEEVVRRFLYTDAGPDALEALAVRHYDAGRYGLAALHYARLLDLRGQANSAPETLFRAMDACHRTGDKLNADLAGKMLLDRMGEKDLRIADQSISRGDVQKELSTPIETSGEWPMFGGNVGRSAQGEGGPAFMGRKWSQPTCVFASSPDRVDFDQKLNALFESASKKLTAANQPVMPPQFPVTATVTLRTNDGPKKMSLIVYRTHAGIAAVDRKSGKLTGITPIKGSFDWMMADPGRENALRQWTQQYIEQNQRPGIVFDNTTIGTLSTDGEFAYAVEDLVVPPAPAFRMQMGFPGNPNPYGWPPEIVELVNHNRLMAYNLASGCKTVWEAPERGDSTSELTDSYFLGPPLAVHGKLYVLAEKQQELRLICLENVMADGAIKPKVDFILPLGAARNSKLSIDVLHRVNASHLSYGEGVLVCPTNLGCVVGVDLLTRTVAWAYRYEDVKADAPPPVGRVFPPGAFANVPQQRPSEWKNSALVVQDGCVVVAPPDSKALICLDLKTGAVRWTSPREDGDLYLAGVFDGRVLVVGRKSCRSISLSDGKPLWTVDTGLPSGQGAAAGGVYYLPLKQAASSKQPEVCAIDMARGKVVAHAPTRAEKPEALGNLVFFNGDLISQTNTEISAYPLLKTMLEQVDAALAKNPDDPEGRVGRAELRLSNADPAGAVEDLRKAIENKPAPELLARARGKLYDALTLLLQNDFKKAEKYLMEYEDLCKTGDDAETHRRRAGLDVLKGRGFESENRPLDALKAYEHLAALGDDPLLPSPEEPAVQVRPSALAQAFIAELLRKATPDQRKELEEEIGRRRKEARESGKLQDLRALAATFGPTTAVGREARLELAKQQVEKNDHAREAEVLLTEVASSGEPTQAAQAVEALAQLSVRLGLFEDAVYYYDTLNRDFGTIAIRDGKTGADLYKESTTDKRLLPFQDKPAPFEGARLKATVEQAKIALTNQTFQFTHKGEGLPFFERYRLSLGFEKHELQLTDGAGGEPRWKTTLAPTMFQNIVTQQSTDGPALPPGFPRAPQFKPTATPLFPYQTLGRVAVVPVGNMVFGIDAVLGKVLWEKDLFEATRGPATQPPAGPAAFQSIDVVARDGDTRLVYADGWIQRIGPGAQVLTPSALCLMTHSGLTALDPLTGRIVWRRDDVAPGSRLFGDDLHLFVVEYQADKPTRTRVLRTADGSTVQAPDFQAVYEDRLQVVGARVLTANSDKDGLTLRLYDPLTGKDLWKETYPAKSIALNSLADGLTGAVEPEGKVHIVDLHSLKEILSVSVQPKSLDSVESVHLLADGKFLFLACNTPLPPNTRITTNLFPGTGLRDLPVNGAVYAFDAATGKMRWRISAENQRLLLSDFTDLPVVVFAAQQTTFQGPFLSGPTSLKTAVRVVNKRVGKRLIDEEDFKGGPFHALEIDAAKGRIELIASQAKLVVAIDAKP